MNKKFHIKNRFPNTFVGAKQKTIRIFVGGLVIEKVLIVCFAYFFGDCGHK